MNLATLSPTMQNILRMLVIDLAAEESKLDESSTVCDCGATRYNNFPEHKLGLEVAALRAKAESMLQKYT